MVLNVYSEQSHVSLSQQVTLVEDSDDEPLVPPQKSSPTRPKKNSKTVSSDEGSWDIDCSVLLITYMFILEPGPILVLVPFTFEALLLHNSMQKIET